MDRGTIHINQALSNLAVGYKNAENIWSQILPPVPVDKETDSYYLFGREFLRHHGKKRANGADAARVKSYSASTDSYVCKLASYEDIITDRDRNLADPVIDPDVRTTNNLMKIIDLDIECDAADVVFASGNYGANTSSPTKKWDVTEAEGTPIEDIDSAKNVVAKVIGIKPNVMVIGKLVFDQLKRHPDLIELYKYTQKGILTADILAEAFGVKKLVIGEAISITTKDGQTITTDYIWGKNCALLYVPEAGMIDEPSFGYTFLHKLYGGMTAMVKKYRWEKSAGDIVEVNRSYAQKVTGQLAGYLYTDVIS